MRQSRDPSPWCSPSSGQAGASLQLCLAAHRLGLVSSPSSTLQNVIRSQEKALRPRHPSHWHQSCTSACSPSRHHEEPALRRPCPRSDALGKRFILSAKARVADLRVLLEQLSRASERGPERQEEKSQSANGKTRADPRTLHCCLQCCSSCRKPQAKAARRNS